MWRWISFFLLLITGSSSLFSLDGFCESERFKRAHVGYSVVDIQTGEELYEQNGEQFFNPASLQKIPTSVVAVSLLGQNHAFATRLEYEGSTTAGGVLQGNIWICGSGDPSLSLPVLREWTDAIHKAGIKRIQGKILTDSSVFESNLASPFWEFQDLGNYYGAGASALNINKNAYRITFQPGTREGDLSTILQIDPPVPELVIHNEVTTGPAGSGDRVYVYGTEYSPIQFYRGTVPLGEKTLSVQASIPNPPLFCAQTLQNALIARYKIEVEDREMTTLEGRTLLHTHSSAPLKNLIEEMHRHSVNLYAEQLLKAVGEGKAEGGAEKVSTYLKQNSIPAVVRDGSGLSRRNMLTPRGFARLLCQIRKTSDLEVIYQSFPEVKNDGSLRIFADLKGAQLRAKTGSMTHVSNLGGYLLLPSGKEFAIALFCNNYEGSIREIREEMLRFMNGIVEAISK